MSRLLAWLLVLAGAAGFAADFARVPPDAVVQRAEGAFWSATDSAGAVLSVPRHVGGVTLQPGETLRVDRLPAGARWAALGLELQSLARGAVIELDLGASDGGLAATDAGGLAGVGGGEIVLAVVADEPVGVFLATRRADGTQAILARAQLAQALKSAFTPFRLRVQRDGSRLDVLVNGAAALSSDRAGIEGGVPAITVRGGAASVRSVLVAEAAASGVAARTWSDDLHALAVPAPWAARVRGLLLAFAALCGAAVLLRALCPDPPAPRDLLDAVAAFAAPPALPLAAQFVLEVPRATLVPLVASLAVVGLCAALWRLRAPLHRGEATPAPAAAPSARARGPGLLRWRGVLACAVAVAALDAATRATLDAWLAERATFLAAQRAARAAPLPPPFSAAGITTLDPGNALVVPGDFRDGELAAGVTLAADSVLELRWRADLPPAPQGVALWVSSDPRLPSSFVRESAADCAPVGTSSPAVPAQRTVPLRVAVRGGRMRADIGDAHVEADELHGAGHALLLLAARGSATLEGLHVEAAAPVADPPGPTRAWALAALLPLLFLLAATAALAWLLPLRLPAALELASLALLPLAAGRAALALDDEGRLRLLERTTFGMAVLLLVPVLVHARRLAAPRLLALLALAILLPTLAVGALASDRRATGGLVPIAFDDTGWTGARLPPDLAWLRHPLLRLLNDYLGDHRFRGREVAASRPPGTRRVIALGGSSTWGFGLAPELHAEYPAVLERLLAEELPAGADAERVEVVNAAWRGATGARLLRFLRDALAPFAPDVVTLSLSYNDSFALTRTDEDGRLAAPTDPSFRRPVFDALIGAHELQRGDDALNRLLVTPRPPSGPTAPTWAQLGHDDSPPARFEAILRQFAALAQERSFRLVLVKEPVASDGPMLWKQEFRDVIDRVGADCGVPVVDPTPALQAAGGADLFQDAIHLRPGGHEVVARELLPVVRAALRR